MEYPHLPKELYKKRVLLDSEILEIQCLYREGVSMKNIAKQYEVSTPTIHWWVDEKWRELVKEKNRKYQKNRYDSDEKYREKIKRNSTLALTRRMRVFPPLKEALYAERAKRDKEKIRKYNKEYRESKGVEIDAKRRQKTLVEVMEQWRKEGKGFIYEKYKHKPWFIEKVLEIEPLLILIDKIY